MISYILAFLSVTLFCLSARQLMASLRKEVNYFDGLDSGYSRTALNYARRYKIFAWGVLTAMLFYSMALLFYESFVLL